MKKTLNVLSLTLVLSLGFSSTAFGVWPFAKKLSTFQKVVNSGKQGAKYLWNTSVYTKVAAGLVATVIGLGLCLRTKKKDLGYQSDIDANNAIYEKVSNTEPLTDEAYRADQEAANSISKDEPKTLTAKIASTIYAPFSWTKNAVAKMFTRNRTPKAETEVEKTARLAKEDADKLAKEEADKLANEKNKKEALEAAELLKKKESEEKANLEKKNTNNSTPQVQTQKTVVNGSESTKPACKNGSCPMDGCGKSNSSCVPCQKGGCGQSSGPVCTVNANTLSRKTVI